MQEAMKQAWRSHTIPVRWHLTDSGAGVGVMAKIVSILAKAKHGTPGNKPPCFVWEIGQQNAHTPRSHRFSTTFAKNPTIFSLARGRFVREKDFFIHGLNYYFKEFMSSAASYLRRLRLAYFFDLTKK